MEHLNRVCKEAILGLKANKTPQALVRVGKVVGILDSVIKNFDEDNKVGERSGKHKVASFTRDMNKIVDVLIQEKALKYSAK